MNQVAAAMGWAWPGRWRLRAAESLSRWAGAEAGRFFPWLAVSTIAGVLLYFMALSEPPWWGGPAVAALAGTGCVLAWRHAAARAVLLVAAMGALGFAAAQGAAGRAVPMDRLPSRAVVLTATVRGVDVLEEGRRLVLEGVRLAPDAAPLPRMVRVRMKRGDMTAVGTGDRVQIRAVLRAPSPPAYPGAWDQQRDAWFSGLDGGGTALNPVVVLERAVPTGWAAQAQAVREAVAARALAALPGTAGAVAGTLLTGATRAIPEADRAAFRDSGLSHLLAVAGLHVGIVMGLFLFVTRLALAAWPHAALHWPTKAIAALVALGAGAAYLVLTGAHVPILRSFAMACLVTLGVVAGRRALSLRGLALAAIVLALVAPQEVVGVSFQMSFAAVVALVAGYEAARPVFARLRMAGWGGAGWGGAGVHGLMLVLTSLLAGTASAPYGAYHFGHVQLYFIAANLVAVPLTAFWVLPLGLAALVLMPFGLERVAFVPMGWGLDAIVAVARGVASWPAATLAVPPLPGWGLAVFSLGLAWLCLWRTRLRLAGIAVMLAGLLSPMVAPPPDLLVSNDGRLIALRQGGAYRMQTMPGSSRFVRDAWRDHLATGPLAPLACGGGRCAEGGLLLLLRGAAPPSGCDGVRLLVSAEPARGLCPGAPLLDRFTVWRDGAHAVWLTPDGPVILSDRVNRGTRPWVPPPPQPGVRATTLPMAPTEPDAAATEDPP